MWLGIFGSSLGGAFAGSAVFGNFNYTTFIFPGILASNLIFGAIGSAISIVADREFGFMKEILVAPISRLTIAVGKTFSGAVITTLSAIPVLLLARLIGVPLNWLSVIYIIPTMLLISICLSGVGVLLASRLKSTESGQFVFQFLIFPMFFLSGALAPVKDLPTWLQAIVYINPATYAVDLLRRITFREIGIPTAVIDRLSVVIGSRSLTIPLDIMILTVFGLIMIFLGVAAFSKSD
jgi:ABC-2 type transport system permease protein